MSQDAKGGKDLKAALGSAIKPDITHVRKALMVYIARACEYGSAKYERANFLRPAGPTLADDFRRLRAYLRAAQNHIVDVLDAIELHQAGDHHFHDERGMKLAAYAPDTDATPGAKVGASGLPHLAHAAASINMAITQAVNAGLIPADPGQPWTLFSDGVPELVADMVEDDDDPVTDPPTCENCGCPDPLDTYHR